MGAAEEWAETVPVLKMGRCGGHPTAESKPGRTEPGGSPPSTCSPSPFSQTRVLVCMGSGQLCEACLAGWLPLQLWRMTKWKRRRSLPDPWEVSLQAKAKCHGLSAAQSRGASPPRPAVPPGPRAWLGGFVVEAAGVIYFPVLFMHSTFTTGPLVIKTPQGQKRRLRH